MIIRTAVKEDLSRLDACMGKLGRFESQFDSNIDCSIDLTGNYAPILADENARIFVAEEDGALIGYCCGFLYHGFGRKSPIALLDALYVEESHRRRGCATRLIQAFLAFARENGVGLAELKVLSGNEAAKQLYASLGFGEIEQKLRLSL